MINFEVGKLYVWEDYLSPELRKTVSPVDTFYGYLHEDCNCYLPSFGHYKLTDPIIILETRPHRDTIVHIYARVLTIDGLVGWTVIYCPNENAGWKQVGYQ